MIHKAGKEPQIIFNRNIEVAAVINPEDFKDYREYKKQKEHESLATVFAELRSICKEEGYAIEIPERRNREAKVN